MSNSYLTSKLVFWAFSALGLLGFRPFGLLGFGLWGFEALGLLVVDQPTLALNNHSVSREFTGLLVSVSLKIL